MDLSEILLLKSDEPNKYFLAFKILEDGEALSDCNQLSQAVAKLNIILNSQQMPSYYKVVFALLKSNFKIMLKFRIIIID